MSAGRLTKWIVQDETNERVVMTTSWRQAIKEAWHDDPPKLGYLMRLKREGGQWEYLSSEVALHIAGYDVRTVK